MRFAQLFVRRRLPRPQLHRAREIHQRLLGLVLLQQNTAKIEDGVGSGAASCACQAIALR